MQKNKKKTIKTWKEETKLSLFVENLVLYIKNTNNPQISTKKFVCLQNQFSNISGTIRK